jgi:hypothetical protein
MTITLPPPPAENICENLLGRLFFVVPLEDIISDFRSLPDEDKNLLVNYIKKYNRQITQLFDASHNNGKIYSHIYETKYLLSTNYTVHSNVLNLSHQK